LFEVRVRIAGHLERERRHLFADVVGGEGDDGAVGPAGEKDCDLLVRAVLCDVSFEVRPYPLLSSV
jgi:hypothetical protein